MIAPPEGDTLPPYLFPPTPNSELANSLKAIADNEAEAGVHFKIIETGGLSLRSVIQRSNPLETAGCDSPDCLPCKPGRGATLRGVGSIMKLNVSCAH